MALHSTLEPGITIFTAAEIRVAVVPIGPIPREVLDEYLEGINKHRHVSLSATRSFYRESAANSPFQYMDWSTGYMHFRFLQANEARRRSRILELYPQRQVLALLGIIYCPLCANLEAAHQEFERLAKQQFPETLVQRCFVFEPSEEHIRQDTQRHENLVMFPPGGQKHLEQHLEVWMHDLAARVLTEFERWVGNPPATVKLNAYVDSAEFTGSNAVLEEVAKRLTLSDEEVREKKRWGRLIKAKGDYCLLAGSPTDAFEHYRSCQELSKVSGDWLWCGAALEGMAQARILQALSSASSSAFAAASGIGKKASGAAAVPAAATRAASAGFGNRTMWELLKRANIEGMVRELFAEARGCYKRKGGALVLQVEQQLKLGRMLAGLHGLRARREVSECCGFIQEVQHALGMPDDRLTALVEAAQVVGLVGSARKRALLLWHAVDTARACDKHDVLRVAIKALEPPDDPHQQDREDLPKVHWSAASATPGTCNPMPTTSTLSCPSLAHRSWPTIHRAALEAVLAAAKQAQAPVEAWEAAATLLREHYGVLAQPYQAVLLESMVQAAGSIALRCRLRPGQGPGPLVVLRRLLPASPPLQPVRLAVGSPSATGRGGAGRGPFIFNPDQAKRQEAVREAEACAVEWVSGDECRVELYLYNPLAVVLQLDLLTLYAIHMEQPQMQLSLSGSIARVPQHQPASPGAASPCSSISRDTPGQSQSRAPETPRLSGMNSASEAQAVANNGGSSVNGALAGAVVVANNTGSSLSRTSSNRCSAPGSSGSAASGPPPLLPPASPDDSELANWQPLRVSMPLTPSLKPIKVVLCGKPMSSGSYRVIGCRIQSGGITWTQPFCAAAKKIGSGGGTGRTGERPVGPPLAPIMVEVLKPLPLLRAVLHGPPELSVTVPMQEDIHAPVGRGAGADPLGRSPPLDVLEGQICGLTLSLTNIGTLPVTAVQLAVANHKGMLLKPLPAGVLAASFMGAHLEVDDAALSAALPLQPQSSVSLPARLSVGCCPRDAFEEVVLEVRLTYSSSSSSSSSSNDGPDTSSGHSQRISSSSSSNGDNSSYIPPLHHSATGTASAAPSWGRRMTLPLPLRIRPSLQLTGLRFLEMWAPLRDGVRLPGYLPDARQLAAAVSAAAVSATQLAATQHAQQQQQQLQHGQLQAQNTGQQTSSLLRGLSGMVLGLASIDTSASGMRPDGSPSRHASVSSPRSMHHPSSSAAHHSGNHNNNNRNSPAIVSVDGLSTSAAHSGHQGAGGGGGSSARPAGSAAGDLAGGSRVAALRGLGGASFGGGRHSNSESTMFPLPARLAGLDLSLGLASRQALDLDDGPGAVIDALPATTSKAILDAGNNSLISGVQGPADPAPASATEDGEPGTSAAVAGSSTAVGASAVVEVSGSCRLSCVSDAVMEVAVSNGSDRYFRTWLTRIENLGIDDWPQVDSCSEVLQPGGSSRLYNHIASSTASLPSAEDLPPARSLSSRPSDAAATMASAAPTTAAAPSPVFASAATATSAAPAATASGARQAPYARQISIVRPRSVHIPGAAGGRRLSEGLAGTEEGVEEGEVWADAREQRGRLIGISGGGAAPTLQLSSSPGSDGANLHSSLTGRFSAQRRSISQPSGGRSGGNGSWARRSTGEGSSGGDALLGDAGALLTEEADRMACAELVAAGWVVAWEMITGQEGGGGGAGAGAGSSSAHGGGGGGGRSRAAPPHGVVRLSTVDIARSLTPTATGVLQPSTVHVQFAVVGGPGCAQPPRLKDLTYRLDALALPHNHLLGEVWGVRLAPGELTEMELQVSHAGRNPHTIRLSLSVTRLQAPPLLPLQPPHLSPLSPQPTFSSALPTIQTRTSSVTAHVKPAAAAAAVSGGYQHHHDSFSFPLHPNSGDRIHPAALLSGVYEGMTLQLEPGGTVCRRLGLRFVEAGFYQVSIADATVLPEGVDAEGVLPGSAPQRVYCSVGRISVLCC